MDITLFVIMAIVGPFGYVSVVRKLVVLGPLATVLDGAENAVGVAVANVILEPTMEANFSGAAACVCPRIVNQDSQLMTL